MRVRGASSQLLAGRRREFQLDSMWQGLSNGRRQEALVYWQVPVLEGIYVFGKLADSSLADIS